MKALLVIRSHAGYGRFLATLEDAGWIVKPAEPRTPYSYSLTTPAYRWRKSATETPLVWVAETAHLRYEVLPVKGKVYATDEEAEAAAVDKKGWPF